MRELSDAAIRAATVRERVHCIAAIPAHLRSRLALLLFAAAVAHAEPRYMVDYLLPRGGGTGSTVQVEFHGSFLDKPKEIVFSRPGISASEFTPYGPGFKVKFQIAKDCPLGEHILRVRTATGLSDAVTFWVSPFPTV